MLISKHIDIIEWAQTPLGRHTHTEARRKCLQDQIHTHMRARARTHTHTHTPRVTEYFFFFNIYLAVLGLSCGRTFDLCCGMWEFVVVVVLACGL